MKKIVVKTKEVVYNIVKHVADQLKKVLSADHIPLNRESNAIYEIVQVACYCIVMRYDTHFIFVFISTRHDKI
jgi:hypothetical protein